MENLLSIASEQRGGVCDDSKGQFLSLYLLADVAEWWSVAAGCSRSDERCLTLSTLSRAGGVWLVGGRRCEFSATVAATATTLSVQGSCTPQA